MTISVNDEIGEVVPAAVPLTLILPVPTGPYPVKPFLCDIEFAPVNVEAIFINSGLTAMELQRSESLRLFAIAPL